MPETPLNPPVTQVTVYTDRAILTRSTETELETGPQTLKIAGLPANLQADSVQVKASGLAKAQLLDVRISDEFFEKIPHTLLQDLQDQIEALRQQVKEIDDKISVLDHKKSFIESIKVSSSETISRDIEIQRPQVEDWQNMLDFMGRNFDLLHRERYQLEAKKKELSTKAEKLQQDARQLAGAGSTRRKVAFVEFEVAEGGAATLEISYQIHNASWRPVYDARVDSRNKNVTLQYYGLVTQHTGEDWENASILLSTARPQLGGNPPELQSWFLDVWTPPVPKPVRAAPPARSRKKSGLSLKAKKEFAMEDEESDMYMEMSAAPVEIPRAEAQVESGQGTSVVFRTQGRNFIPGDGSEGRLRIMENELGNTFQYLTVPRLTPHVYLRANVENSSEYPLLPGKINVFLDNSFVGNSTLGEVITPGEKFDLNLGVDESIKVTHKLMKQYEDEKGIFTKSQTRLFDYLITVENLRESMEEITVRDQLPVSRNDEIKVKVLEIAPDENPAKDVKKLPTGSLEWKFDLDSKAKKEIRFSWRAEFPNGTKVTGL